MASGTFWKYIMNRKEYERIIWEKVESIVLSHWLSQEVTVLDLSRFMSEYIESLGAETSLMWNSDWPIIQ